MPKRILTMTSKNKDGGADQRHRWQRRCGVLLAFLTDLQQPPPWLTCKRRRRGRYLSRQQAPNAKHPQFHPSTDIGPRRCVISANVLGSRSLTLWPRSVAMGRGRASSGAHLPQLHPLTGIGPRSCIIDNRFRAFGGGPFVMLYRNNNEPHGKLYDR
jgi:hypothetical protein